jgi:hypothetical protein
MKTSAERIVTDIIDDLTNRRALRQAWDDIDEDIQQEIRDTWAVIVQRELARMARKET